jgi:hypothetical protein
MNVKRSLIALAATGGVAALAFGGTAVSTAFTSDQTGQATAESSFVNGTLSGNSIDFPSLLPGATVAASGKPVATNTGNTTEDVFVIVNSISTTNGTDGQAPNLNDATISGGYLDSSSGTTSNFSENLGGLAGHQNQAIEVGTLAVGQDFAFHPSLTLVQTAGNDWNGATVKITYTVHFQDASDTDKGNYVGESDS